MLKSAVLLLIFNRPDLTSKAFACIKAYQPQKLFIASDGQRADHPGEERLCKESIEATQCIDWECEVHRLERKENLGCRVAVSSAISWFFKHVEEGIILEDDCLPDSSFFLFCSDMLEYYRKDEKIGIVSGGNFQKYPCRESYYFTRYPLIWGWATWRRVWQHYDVDLASWNGDPRSLFPYIKRHSVRRFFKGRFDSVKWKHKDTWDFQLAHLCFSRGLYCINPAKNLVANIGFDDRATHTRIKGDAWVPPAFTLDFPLRHPSRIEIDEKADLYTETYIQKISPDILASFRKRIHKLRAFLTRAN